MDLVEEDRPQFSSGATEWNGVQFRFSNGALTVFELNTDTPHVESEDADPRELVVAPAAPDFDNISPTGRIIARRPPLVHWVARGSGLVHRNGVLANDSLEGTSRGEVFVGRAFCLGELMAGCVRTIQRKCYVAYDGQQFSFPRYEVLVVERGFVKWVPSENGHVPPCALRAGLRLDQTPIYSVRVFFHGVMMPGQLILGETHCRIPFSRRECRFTQYEVLSVAADSSGVGLPRRPRPFDFSEESDGYH